MLDRNSEDCEAIINGNNENRDQCIKYIDYLLHGGDKVQKPLFYVINKEELEIDYCDAAIVYFYNLYKKGMMSTVDYQKAEDELEARKLFARNKSKAHKLRETEKKEKLKLQKIEQKNRENSVSCRHASNNENLIILILSIIVASLLMYFKIF